MVTQRLTHDPMSTKEFATTRDFLADFGIAPNTTDEYAEEDVLRAIRHRGWEPSLAQEVAPPGWKAEIREWRTVSQSRASIAHDRDRMIALLSALRLALAWSTPEEELQAFDEQTRSLLGLSAEQFFERWQKNELSTDDPRVVHLLVTRPLGW
jgi:hypothetical protein